MDASDTLDLTAWNMCYTTLYYARIYGSQTLVPQETVNAWVENFVPTANNTIQIPVLHYDYNTLRTDAVSAGLLQKVGERLYDVPNRPASPYVNQTLFAAAPEKSYSHTGTVHFLFRSQLFFQNRQKTVQSIELDADNGQGYQVASFDIPLTINYYNAGDKLIKVRFTYTDGSSAVSQSFLEVETNWVANFYNANNVVAVDLPATVEHSGGTLQILYSVNNTTRNTPNPQLMRPLLVIEGFDQHHVAPSLQRLNYDIATFIRRINDAGTFDFNFNLDNTAGFDLVFLDYNDGVDDIRRNAQLFREAIRWVNTNKINNVNNGNIREENVVLGMSMGGLVARYGLAAMEKERRSGVPDNVHETRLLLTHDSPHRGANIAPLGSQLLFRTLADNPLLYVVSKDLIDATTAYNRPATGQQAIYWVQRNSRWNYSYRFNTFLDNEYRTMITFPANAPAPYREVASSNGAACGERLFEPGADLFDFSGRLFKFWKFGNVPNILGPSLRFELDINALPHQGQVKRIFYSRQYFRLSLFGIHLDITLNSTSYNSTPNMLPYDGTAGGTEELDSVDTDAITGSTIFGRLWRSILFNPQVSIHQSDFCFVPRTSALDLETVDQSALNSPYTQGFSPSNPSSFESFYTEPQTLIGTDNFFNLAHLQFTARNAQWLYNEMIGNTPNNFNCNGTCVPAISSNAIQGSLLICSAESYNLDITLPPHISFLDWTTSNNNLSIDPITGVAVANTTSGASSIIARLQTHCGDIIEVTKQVWVGVPNPVTQPIGINISPIGFDNVNGPLPVCPNTPIVFSAFANNPYQANANFQWQFSSGGTVIDQQESGGMSFLTASFNPITMDETGYISVRAFNECGFSTWKTMFIDFVSCSGSNGNVDGLASGFSLFENPVGGNSMEMALMGNNLGSTLSNPYNLKIYDHFGVERKNITTDQTALVIDVSNLENGLYHAVMILGNEVFQEHFQVNR